jgi:hypothetical protein
VVDILIYGCVTEMVTGGEVLGSQNRFILKASEPQVLAARYLPALEGSDRADVLFHVLRNKPKVGSAAGGSKKLKKKRRVPWSEGESVTRVDGRSR